MSKTISVDHTGSISTTGFDLPEGETVTVTGTSAWGNQEGVNYNRGEQSFGVGTGVLKNDGTDDKNEGGNDWKVLNYVRKTDVNSNKDVEGSESITIEIPAKASEADVTFTQKGGSGYLFDGNDTATITAYNDGKVVGKMKVTAPEGGTVDKATVSFADRTGDPIPFDQLKITAHAGPDFYELNGGHSSFGVDNVSFTVPEVESASLSVTTDNAQTWTPDFGGGIGAQNSETQTVDLDPAGSGEGIGTQESSSVDMTHNGEEVGSISRSEDGALHVELESNWNSVKSVNVTTDDKETTDINVDNFVHAEVNVTHDKNTEVNITDAKRGEVNTAGGNDKITVDTQTNGTGWDNTFTINSGDGRDKIVVDGSQKADGSYYDQQVTHTKIDAGNGNDRIITKNSIDDINAGAGRDFIRAGEERGDKIDGGTGSDTVSYQGNNGGTGVTVNLADGTASNNDGSTGVDQLSNVENIKGSRHDDVITGDAENNKLSGGRGDDTLDGGAGNDRIKGGKGNDELYGGEGIDTLDYSGSRFAEGEGLVINMNDTGMVTVDAGSHGTDSVDMASFENVKGGRGDDVIIGSNGDNKISGGKGDDKLYGDQELISNGGFEFNTVGAGKWAYGANAGLQDWSGNAEIQEGGFGGTPYSDRDDASLELDSHGSNSHGAVTQTVTVGDAGGFTLEFEAGARMKGGDYWNTSQFEVKVGNQTFTMEQMGLHDGKMVDGKMVESNFNNEGFTKVSLDVDIPAEDIVNGQVDISFIGTGTQDTYGALIDNVSFMARGNDVLKGGKGNDELYGGAGDDKLKGGKGDDILVGGSGKDQLFGGRGNDMLVFDNADFEDVRVKERGDKTIIKDKVYDGGRGFDVLQVGEQTGGEAAEINFMGRGINGIEAVVANQEDTVENVTIGLNEIARTSDDAGAARNKAFDAFTFIGNGGDDTLNLMGKGWELVGGGNANDKVRKVSDDAMSFSGNGELKKQDLLGNDEMDQLRAALDDDSAVEGLNAFVFKKGSQYVTIWTDLDVSQINFTGGNDDMFNAV